MKDKRSELRNEINKLGMGCNADDALDFLINCIPTKLLNECIKAVKRNISKLKE